MRKSTLYFILMIGGIVILILVTFVMLFTTDAAEYKDESTPEGIAQNYLLAIQKEDYERAYSYLSKSISNYPTDVNIFINDLDRYTSFTERRKGIIFSVDSGERKGSQYIVTFTAISSSGNSLLSGNQYSSNFTVTLVKENSQWKIVNCSHYYFWSFLF